MVHVVFLVNASVFPPSGFGRRVGGDWWMRGFSCDYASFSNFRFDGVRRGQPWNGAHAFILVHVSMKRPGHGGGGGQTMSVTRAVPRITFLKSKPNGMLCKAQSA